MSAIVNTVANIIVTVDHTGYVGPITIGAMLTPPDSNGLSANVQVAGVNRVAGQTGYQAELMLESGKTYILYAVTESTTQILGGAAYYQMPSEEVTVHLTMYGQPMLLLS